MNFIVLINVFFHFPSRDLKKGSLPLQLKSADVGKISDKVSGMSLGPRDDVFMYVHFRSNKF